VVEYNRRGQLDTSRVRDRRGAGGAGGGGRIAIGGGVGGLIVLLLAVVFGVDPSLLLEGGTDPTAGGAAPADGGLAACVTGADIEERPACRFVAYENSVQDFWAAEFERRGATYEPASFTVFTGGVSTGCGSASSAMGPFYCPADRGVYLDLGFFAVLEQELGARGGDLAEAYVVAHEVGHHVQNLTGYNARVRTRQGQGSDAVRLELQADCLAGLWAHHATRTPVPGTDEPIITAISDDDISIALDAAGVIGDDYLQTRSQGNVTPETWSHGSSEQRVRWFTTGLGTGRFEACDTWVAPEL
jgi:uncharacterized protein